MQKTLIFLALLACSSLSAQEVLTFEEAVQRTFCQSPLLHISNDEIGERAGARQQSKRLPNPTAAWSVENVFGNREWQGWESAESRYEIGQLIELGGKRSYRSNAATYQLFAAQAGYAAQKTMVLNRLSKAFAEVAGLQEQVKLADEQAKIADEVYKTVSAKLEAGRISLIQQNKAEIALWTARISYNAAVTDFAKAKERLSAFWGCSCPDFNEVDYWFYELAAPESLEECFCTLENNPELLRSHFEYLSSQQNLNLERAGSVPDVTVAVGYKTLRETGNKGMILGASIPIPIFNQNQGNIQKARFESQKMQDQFQNLQLVLKNRLSAAYRDLIRAYREAEQLKTSVLKNATQSFDLASEGYKEGKFEYLDVLDSQRTLFDVRGRYIQTLVNYHKSMADIKYLNSQSEIL
ncbi:MAG: TolC family protein [Chlamydiales bacterium]|nr:TolC family protein [Chlamydiales bacterium]